MDAGWLDDLIALSEARTLTLAAELRAVTQPAFSRRIQQIENWLGIPVLDRSRRPARVTPAILRKIEELRALSSDLRNLRVDVREWEAAHRRVPVAAQHTISMGLLPPFIARLRQTHPSLSIRLRSANRNECYALLMTRQVRMMIAYEIRELPIAPEETLIERLELGDEELCAVGTPAIASSVFAKTRALPELPMVGFPAGTFFGEVVARKVLPQVQRRFRVSVSCETALIPGALAIALEGAGVAWLPRSLCGAHLRSGQLIEMELAEAVPMKIVCARRATSPDQNSAMVWDELRSSLKAVQNDRYRLD